MTLQSLTADPSRFLLKCISGSRAYGLALPHSDTDLKGVFVLPMKEFYGLTYTDQVSNATNDETYYELRKFVELLIKNNPNMLELLCSPEDCIVYRHALVDVLRPEMFLSRLCNQTFGQYAYAQIKKARGLNKKIVNPIDRTRKSILDFCYVIQGQGSVPVTTWLAEIHRGQEECGLVSIPHMRNLYALFLPQQTGEEFNGLYSSEKADDVSLSSIPKGMEPAAALYFNKDGYSVYCKEYRQYWQWVEHRNEVRYEHTIAHGKHYDTKNAMHVFRILNMAEEIARFKKINVRRPDRDRLLRIRNGEFTYEDLLSMADEKMRVISERFEKSDLPEAPDRAQCEALLVQMRERF